MSMCDRTACLDAIRKFFLLVRPEHTQRLALCTCNRPDCLAIQQAMRPTCSMVERPPPSCSDLLHRCLEDNDYRCAAFITSYFASFPPSMQHQVAVVQEALLFDQQGLQHSFRCCSMSQCMAGHPGHHRHHQLHMRTDGRRHSLCGRLQTATRGTHLPRCVSAIQMPLKASAMRPSEAAPLSPSALSLCLPTVINWWII